MMSRHQYEEVMRYIDEFYPKYSDPFDIKEEIDEKRIELGEANKKKYFNKLFNGIKKAAQGYHVKDFTDEEFPGLAFKVLLHENQDILDDDRELIEALGGTKYEIEVYVSMISPFFCMYVNRTDYQKENDVEIWSFSVTHDFPNIAVVERVKDYLLSQNKKEISLLNALVLVDERDVPYTKEEKATIFDCLFDNMVTIYLLNRSRKSKHTSEEWSLSWNWDENVDWDSLRYDPDKAEE